MSENPILWNPGEERQQASAMYRFMRAQGFDDYDDLYRWSIDNSPAFWEALSEFCSVRFDKVATTTLARPGDIMDAGWFEGGELNYAEHLLRHAGDRSAVIFCGENGARRELSFDQLRDAVAAVAAGLRNAGVERGDRVGGFLPNCPEAIVAMLATTSLGATWSSCSPDFGVNGVVDRFGQIEPKVLFATDGYYYNGKRIDSLPVVAGIVERFGRTVHHLERIRCRRQPSEVRARAV
jgi:acetoacetyl-CoA synthetase